MIKLYDLLIHLNNKFHIGHLLVKCSICGGQYWDWSVSSYAICQGCLRQHRDQAHQRIIELEQQLAELKKETETAWQVIRHVDKNSHIDGLSRSVWKAIDKYYNTIGKNRCCDGSIGTRW